MKPGLPTKLFQKEIKAYYPNTETKNLFQKNGPKFYQSVEQRKACCTIRKVHPLKSALKGYKVWITGLRAEHSPNRQNMPALEWDEDNQIIKFHPLLHWNTEQVTDYVKPSAALQLSS
jgi:phosphoadenosine phosphosulfate reductase